MASRNLLRVRHGHEHSRVTFVELFFDLVFVFAVTQLSHSLLEHLTPLGAIQTVVLLMAVWWVWMYTSWATNWLNPETTPVRLVLFAIMLAGLILSSSIPDAFNSRGLAFAVPLVLIQVCRTAFITYATRNYPALRRNFMRVTIWLAFSGVFWIAGGLAEGNLRLALWIVALFLDYISPSLAFWTPGLGRSQTSDWNVEGGHMAERCGLFIIIALGESIIVIGATFSGAEWSAPIIGAFLSSFVASVAMWWIYFYAGAERGTAAITASVDPGRVARLAYTYIHLPIVAGIIVTAVGDEHLLAHPGGYIEPATAAVILGGPAIYLLGTLLFKWAISGRVLVSHLTGIAALAALSGMTPTASPLALSIASTIVLIAVAAWETLGTKATD